MPGQGRRGERPQIRQGVGSGFFISADGYVVTNNHVVDGAKTVQVTTDDGRALEAKVIGADAKTDVALLKVTEGGSFPFVKLAKAPAAGRRLGGRDRQPVRPRRHGHLGHRLGARPRHRRRPL